MARAPRVDVGDLVYHVINRANGRMTIFEEEWMYQDFEYLLNEMRELYSVRILAYTIMPNHWHLLLYPRQDGDLSAGMGWLGTAHTRRYHAQTHTIGGGHLYQGRYKSFLVDDDTYLLTVIKYIERNPVRAKLSKTAESWRGVSKVHQNKEHSSQNLQHHFHAITPRGSTNPNPPKNLLPFEPQSSRVYHMEGSRGVII